MQNLKLNEVMDVSGGECGIMAAVWSGLVSGTVIAIWDCYIGIRSIVEIKNALDKGKDKLGWSASAVGISSTVMGGVGLIALAAFVIYARNDLRNSFRCNRHSPY